MRHLTTGIAAALAVGLPGGWPMRPVRQAFWLSAATTVTVLGGGYAAYAAWAPAMDAGTIVLNTVFLPTGNRPTAVVHGTRVSVTWRASQGVDNRRSLTYVVIRTGAGVSTEACVVTTTTCRDVGVPAGTWTYTVRPDLGPWQGRESPPGAPVTVPAGPEPTGPAGAPAVPARPGARPAPAATSAPVRSPAVEAIGDRPGPVAATAVDAGPGVPPETGPATGLGRGLTTGPEPAGPGPPADYRRSAGGISSGR